MSADAVIRIEEGQAEYDTQRFRPKREVVDERIAAVTEPGEYRGVWLLEPIRMPTLKLTGVKRGSPAAVTFSAGTGKAPVPCWSRTLRPRTE